MGPAVERDRASVHDRGPALRSSVAELPDPDPTEPPRRRPRPPRHRGARRRDRPADGRGARASAHRRRSAAVGPWHVRRSSIPGPIVRPGQSHGSRNRMRPPCRADASPFPRGERVDGVVRTTEGVTTCSSGQPSRALRARGRTPHQPPGKRTPSARWEQRLNDLLLHIVTARDRCSTGGSTFWSTS